MTFDTLGLSADLVRTVAEEGYEHPTPVQKKAIPLVLAGGDVLAAAQTGTGKTAAFTLPILDRLRKHANTSFSPARHAVRALILVPTRELAQQVDESVRTYGRTVPLRSTVVYGGIPMDRDCISPANHTAFTDVSSMLDFIERLADATGLPVGIKSAVGDFNLLEP